MKYIKFLLFTIAFFILSAVPALALNKINVHGSIDGEAGVVLTNSNTEMLIYMVGSGENFILSDGMTFYELYLEGTGTTTLIDDLQTAKKFSISNGVFDAVTSSVQALENGVYLFGDSGYTPTVKMGTNDWTVSLWEVSDAGSYISIMPEDSTIKIPVDNGYGDFIGGGKTYNNLNIASDAGILMFGSNIFNDITIEAGAEGIKFAEDYTTTTVSSFNALGVESDEIVLTISDGSGDGIPHILKMTSGKVCADFLDITSSTATGGADWYAGSNSIDNGGNTGWLFEDCPATPITATENNTLIYSSEND